MSTVIPISRCLLIDGCSYLLQVYTHWSEHWDTRFFSLMKRTSSVSLLMEYVYMQVKWTVYAFIGRNRARVNPIL